MINQVTGKAKGRVQGVGFRYYCREQALLLGLTGWVRNEPNGELSFLAQGDQQSLVRFLACLRSGPPTAQVIELSEDWTIVEKRFEQFEIVR